MMKQQNLKKWITFTLRWGIAVLGIWWVVRSTPFRDRLLLVDPQNQIVSARVLNEPAEGDQRFEIIDAAGHKKTIERSTVWTQPDKASVRLDKGRDVKKAKLLAIRPGARHDVGAPPAELLIVDPDTGKHARITPDRVAGGYHVNVPYP